MDIARIGGGADPGAAFTRRGVDLTAAETLMIVPRGVVDGGNPARTRDFELNQRIAGSYRVPLRVADSNSHGGDVVEVVRQQA